MITRTPLLLLLSLLWTTGVASFGIVPPASSKALGVATSTTRPITSSSSSSTTALYMSDQERSRTTKKGTKVMDKTETKVEEKKNKEEMWRVVLHNDEVHTFNYVIRSLTKVIGTLDRKAAFEICVQTHGIGKATVTKTWKKQSEQFCLGLQRQGLTVSISPDKDFDGGHSGGGL
jgi:ATP-dependent Clp protease adapter protein ClpS